MPTGADGLGNQRHNSLCICQLRFIQRLIDQQNEGSGASNGRNYWWCDTLCVPVNPIYDEQRKQAIREMRHTYANAACVLALDAELMTLRADALPVEMYIRLKLSSWSRRVWTLQEAALAKVVMIQLSDGVRSLKQVLEAVKTDGQKDERDLYRRYSFLAKSFFQPFRQQHQELSIPTQMIDMWKQLQWRATSRQADEAVCFATIMGFEPGPVLQVSSTNPGGRMAVFLRLVRIIPFVLLIQPPPRIPLVGFQWAPLSLLNCFRNGATNPFRTVPGVGILDSDGQGLHMERPGVTLEPERLVSSSFFEWTGKVFSLAVERSPGEKDLYQVLYLFPQDQEQLHVSKTSRSGKPVIIFLEADGLPLGAKGMCVLGEMSEGAGSANKQYTRVHFVTIVTVVVSASGQEAVFPFKQVEKHHWLLV